MVNKLKDFLKNFSIKSVSTDLGFIALIVFLFSIYQKISSDLRIVDEINFSNHKALSRTGFTIKGSFYMINTITVHVKNKSVKVGRILDAEIFPKGNSSLYYKTKVLHVDKLKIYPFKISDISVMCYFECDKPTDLMNDTSTSFLIRLLDEEKEYIKDEDGKESGYLVRPLVFN